VKYKDLDIQENVTIDLGHVYNICKM